MCKHILLSPNTRIISKCKTKYKWRSDILLGDNILNFGDYFIAANDFLLGKFRQVEGLDLRKAVGTKIKY